MRIQVILTGCRPRGAESAGAVADMAGAGCAPGQISIPAEQGETGPLQMLLPKRIRCRCPSILRCSGLYFCRAPVSFFLITGLRCFS